MKPAKLLLATALAVLLAVSWLPGRSIAAGEPIELNAILSLTGSGAFLGTAEQSGMLQAADAVNKAGGIAGRPVKVIIQDDGSNAQTALTLANGLIANKVQVIFGPTLSAGCSALAPLVRNGPLVYCFSAGMQPERGSYMFTYQVSSADSIGVDARYFRAHGLKRIAMLTSTDSSGQVGEAAIDATLAQPENKDLSLVAREHYNVTDLSVAAQIARIKASSAQVMIAWGTGTPIGTVFRSVRDAGLDIPVAVSAGNDIYPEMKQFAAILPRELISAAPPNIVLDTLPERSGEKCRAAIRRRLQGRRHSRRHLRSERLGSRSNHHQRIEKTRPERNRHAAQRLHEQSARLSRRLRHVRLPQRRSARPHRLAKPRDGPLGRPERHLGRDQQIRRLAAITAGGDRRVRGGGVFRHRCTGVRPGS